MKPSASTPDLLSLTFPGLNLFLDVPLPLPDSDNYIGVYVRQKETDSIRQSTSAKDLNYSM